VKNCIKPFVSFCQVATLQEIEAQNEYNDRDGRERTHFCFVGDLHAKGFNGGSTLKKDKIQHKKSYRQTQEFAVRS
jgi:hypothetical protein